MHLITIDRIALCSFFFFFNDTATTEIYTLSLHDALPICRKILGENAREDEPDPVRNAVGFFGADRPEEEMIDRKSTRLNSSHGYISYAVFCLKKKNTPSH